MQIRFDTNKLKRHKVFMNDITFWKSLSNTDKAFMNGLQILSNVLDEQYANKNNLSFTSKLKNILIQVYDFVIEIYGFKYFEVNYILELYPNYKTLFSDEIDKLSQEGYEDLNFDGILSENLYNIFFEACLFFSLCYFLNNTKLIKNVEIKEFVYKYSHLDFNVKKSKLYFPYNKHSENEDGYYLWNNEYDNFRKARNRFYTDKGAYTGTKNISTLSKDLEFETSLIYKIMGYNDIDDVDKRKEYEEYVRILKRLKSLYKKLNKSIESEKDTEYCSKLNVAIEETIVKAKKLNYSKVLAFKNYIAKELFNEDTYIGINLYRFERCLKYYRINSLIDEISKCGAGVEENVILNKFVILKDIPFIKVYNNLALVEDLECMFETSRAFTDLMKVFAGSSFFVINDFVEKGVFGGDWENMILNEINHLSKTVLYDKSEIGYTASPKANEYYLRILLSPLTFLYNKL